MNYFELLDNHKNQIQSNLKETQICKQLGTVFSLNCTNTNHFKRFLAKILMYVSLKFSLYIKAKIDGIYNTLRVYLFHFIEILVSTLMDVPDSLCTKSSLV